MGVSNLHCAISGKLIQPQELAIIIPIKKNKSDYVKRIKFDWYYAITTPLVGKYDEYGFVDLKDLEQYDLEAKLLSKHFIKEYKLEKLDAPNSLWGGIIDSPDINYTIISFKSYEAIEKLVNSKEKKNFLFELTKLKKDYDGLKGMFDEYNKDETHSKKMKPIDPLFILNHNYIISRLLNRELSYIQRDTFIEYLHQENKYLSLYMLFIIATGLDNLGRPFTPPLFGKQENNRNYVDKLNELLSHKRKKNKS